MTMESGQITQAYGEDDVLDVRLLNQISKWILYHRLPSLARHLGISDAEISRIMIPSRTSEEQCFQVGLITKRSKYDFMCNLLVTVCQYY